MKLCWSVISLRKIAEETDKEMLRQVDEKFYPKEFFEYQKNNKKKLATTCVEQNLHKNVFLVGECPKTKVFFFF